MDVSLRRGIEFDVIEERVAASGDASIELALPYQPDEYLAGRHRLGEISRAVKDAGVKCTSVHAPHIRITHPDFRGLAEEIVRFALDLGTGVVVFHPERVRKADKAELQPVATETIKALQDATGAVLSIETFSHNRRIFTPEETIACGLQITLDTSHLPQRRSMQLVREHAEKIVNVHLSEARFNELEGHDMTHMPIGDFGFSVIRRLLEQGWDRVITLEYLFDYHQRMFVDRDRIIAFIDATRRTMSAGEKPGPRQ
jgi:sugar phosphate isomerase/epimerase